MAIAGRSYPNVPVISRGALEDPADFIGRQPVTIAAPYDRRWFAPGVFRTLTGSPLAVPAAAAQQGTAAVTVALAATAVISNVLAGTVTIVNDL